MAVRTLLALWISTAFVLCIEPVPSYANDFPYEDFSFNSHVNLDVCSSYRVEAIPPSKSSKYDYGAVINELLTAVAKDGGGTVLLPNGVYYLRTPIRMLNSTCLEGKHQKKTVLRVHESLTNAILIHNVVRVHIGHLTINGRGRVDFGVNVLRSKFVLVHGIKVTRTRATSVLVRQSVHTAVDSVLLYRSTQNCIHLRDTTYTAIVGGKQSRCGKHGILVHAARRLRITGVRLSRGLGCGIAVGGTRSLASARVHITACRIHDFKRSGICASRAGGIIMDYNKLTSKLYPHADCVDVGDGVQSSTMILNSCDGDGINTKPLGTTEIRELGEN